MSDEIKNEVQPSVICNINLDVLDNGKINLTAFNEGLTRETFNLLSDVFGLKKQYEANNDRSTQTVGKEAPQAVHDDTPSSTAFDISRREGYARGETAEEL